MRQASLPDWLVSNGWSEPDQSALAAAALNVATQG